MAERGNIGSIVGGYAQDFKSLCFVALVKSGIDIPDFIAAGATGGCPEIEQDIFTLEISGETKDAPVGGRNGERDGREADLGAGHRRRVLYAGQTEVAAVIADAVGFVIGIAQFQIFVGRTFKQSVGRLTFDQCALFPVLQASNVPATVHFVQFAGENTHHILEACFKGAGHALAEAVRIDVAHRDEIPSTKGLLV